MDLEPPLVALNADYLSPLNTEAHAIAKSQLASGKVKFLIDERIAKNKLLAKKKGQTMTPE